MHVSDVLQMPHATCKLVLVPTFIFECFVKMYILVFFHVGALYFSLISCNDLCKVLISLFMFLGTDSKTLS